MKEFKGFIFYFTIVYIVVCSFLIISIHSNSEKKMNETLDFTAEQEFNDFIFDSKTKLNEYKQNAVTNERRECLDEVEKAIDYIYKTQNQGEKTYKELWKDYLLSITYNYDELLEPKSENIFKKCNISETNDIELEKDKKELVRGSLMYSVILVADVRKHFNSSTIPLTIGLKKVFMDIGEPSYSSLLKRGKMDIPSQMQQLGKDYISSVLKLVGDKYEE